MVAGASARVNRTPPMRQNGLQGHLAAGDACVMPHSISRHGGSERRAPLPNRVDPLGRLFATSAKGALMGNRGGLFHDPATCASPRRGHASRRWIICETAFLGREIAWRASGRQVWDGSRYTELFFLDEPTALSAGHRPCMECRRAANLAYRDALVAAGAFSSRPGCNEVDGLLHGQRRSANAMSATAADLPDGAFVLWRGGPAAVRGGALLPWRLDGYGKPVTAPASPLPVLTPALNLAALSGGYRPRWHGEV
jgi:hypothetical protein